MPQGLGKRLELNPGPSCVERYEQCSKLALVSVVTSQNAMIFRTKQEYITPLVLTTMADAIQLVKQFNIFQSEYIVIVLPVNEVMLEQTEQIL